METPSIEQVKKHFENAKLVRFDDYCYEVEDISDLLGNCSKGNKDINDIYTEFSNKGIRHLLYESSNNKYAEIISYKEKTYTLTETFVKELCKEPNIKEAFVREGIVEEEKLEVGKWYKSRANRLIYRTGNYDNYGFCRNMIWKTDLMCYEPSNWKLATPQEVKTALISEAKKRGLTPENLKNINCVSKWNNGDKQEYYNELSKFKYEHSTNSLWLVDGSYLSICLFQNGTWAEIIEETRTIEIPLKDILATPNDLELGEMVRKLANQKL